MTPDQLEALVQEARGPKPEDALTKLYTRFLPLIHKAARSNAGNMDRDDAFGVAQERFVELIREGVEVRSYKAFTSFLGAAMGRAVMEASRVQRGIVMVPPRNAERYHQLLKDHGGDRHAAYEACKAGGLKLSAHTFLALDEALASSDISVDTHNDTRDTYGPGYAIPTRAQQVELQNRSPWDRAQHAPSALTPDVLEWLWTEVTERQQSVVRLAYGFRDRRSEDLRDAFGFRESTPLMDFEVAAVLRLSRATITVDRNKALRQMRDALVSAMEED